MKKTFTFILLSLLSVSGIKANMAKGMDKSIYIQAINESSLEVTEPQTPTYIERAIVPSWKDNWFINVSGGISSFIGSPIGCEDLFGRLKPVLQVGFGKWFTPSVGSRLVFQGFEWKSGELKNQDYYHYHADFLWNVIPSFYAGDNDYKFDVIPFVGLGLFDNRTAHTRPFAVNYGVQGRFRLSDNFHITLELSNATSFKNTDGIGSATQLGDNLLSLSAGISWTFGKNVGWKKIIDPMPYIERNDRMSAYIIDRENDYNNLRHEYSENANLLAELKKILEIEGILSKYAGLFDKDSSTNGLADNTNSSSSHPSAFNDYEGLRLLKERLRNGSKYDSDNIDNDSANMKDSSSDSDNSKGDKTKYGKNKGKKTGKDSSNTGRVNEGNNHSGNGNEGSNSNGNERYNGKYRSGRNGATGDNSALLGALRDSLNTDRDLSYLLAIIDNGEPIGSPIYFFFELGTTNLVNESQKVNLNEIARIAEKYDLIIGVEGAADSSTGTEVINSELGNNRAEYIANYLVEKGISADNIFVSSKGGIDDYTPVEANRNTIVTLYLK